MDRINPATRARILSDWTPVGQSRLRRCIRNHVTASSAATLENVEKSKPVTNFVSDCSAEIVVSKRATWGCGVEDVETISAGRCQQLAIGGNLGWRCCCKGGETYM